LSVINFGYGAMESAGGLGSGAAEPIEDAGSRS